MNKQELTVIGWREYACLPLLKIDQLKVKIDTGAKTSCLHAVNLHTYQQFDRKMIKFEVHPVQKNNHLILTCIAPLLEYRYVTNSGGQTQLRPVIETTIKLGNHEWKIEITLTNRDVMGFRMLLGRQALYQRFLVDVSKSFLT